MEAGNLVKLGEAAYDSSCRILAAHCPVDMGDVPEYVSRSIRIASEATRKRLYPAASISRWRSSRVVVRMGSTLLMRNGSIIGGLGMRKAESPCRHYHNL